MNIELLSPAADLARGKSALDAGADAVYIGGASFSARTAAHNTMDEVAQLVDYAHAFGAKVYMAMNTMLLETELAPAQRQAYQAWEVGVDALIVQDMAFCEMELPPIALHASTQTFNLGLDRIRFLEQVGFSRVILERAISLEEVRHIRANTNIELEAFVHGAVCVSYSGQCYLGHALCSRGGNRGACAQPCRATYDLVSGSGRTLASKQTLLSVGDLNLSDRLGELLDAGVSSLKIEGRLKELDYVINNTLHYHRKLEQLGVQRTSQGIVRSDFEPNPAKSFSRGFTPYFFDGPLPDVRTKTKGESLGEVLRVGPDHFEYPALVPLAPGDGLCLGNDQQGILFGTNVNRVEGKRVYPNRMDGITSGLSIYRTSDNRFRVTARSVNRRIPIEIRVSDNTIEARDAQGSSVTLDYDGTSEARNITLARENIIRAMSKGAESIFAVAAVEINCRRVPFLPSSTLNELRRKLIEQLTQQRIARNRPTPWIGTFAHPAYGADTLSHRGNVANSLARAFYEQCGVRHIESAYELNPVAGVEILRSRYCIRREMGICLQQSDVQPEKLFITNNNRKLELRFDCRKCEMTIYTI